MLLKFNLSLQITWALQRSRSRGPNLSELGELLCIHAPNIAKKTAKLSHNFSVDKEATYTPFLTYLASLIYYNVRLYQKRGGRRR